MAKTKTAVEAGQDDLLGNDEQVVSDATKRSEAEIQAEIDALAAQVKALKQEKKGQKPKVEKILKGEMVTFQNKAKEQITGMGTLYYVVRFANKLHYKEASQVTKLPVDWKEGDPITSE